MKKIIGLLLLLALVATITLLCYKSYTLYTIKREARAKLRSTPSMNLTGLDGKYFSFSGEKGIVMLVYYSGACDLCDFEAEQFEKNISQLSSLKIMMVSTDPLDSIQRFSKRHHLQELITFGKIKDEDVLAAFGTEALPHILIYNDEILVGEFKGATPFSKLKDALKLNN